MGEVVAVAKSVWDPIYNHVTSFKGAGQVTWLDRLRKALGLGCIHCGASPAEFECELCRRRACDHCSGAYMAYVRDFISDGKKEHPKLLDRNRRFCQPCSHPGFLESQQVLGMDTFLERPPTSLRIRRG